MNWVLPTLLCVSLFCLPQALGQSPVWSAESNVAGYRLGTHILACDINNDTYPDVVSTGLNGVYVWLGGPGGTINTTADYMIDVIIATVNTDGLGLECADVNSDGYPDVIIGNWTGSLPYIRIYNGSATGLSTTPYGWTLAASGNWYGSELAAADYNNDGKIDLAVGAFGIARVYLHMQTAAGLTVTAQTPSALYYQSITYAQNMWPCDFSGDGYPDLLVGCRSCNTQKGMLFVVSNSGGTWTNVHIWNGTATTGFYGFDAKCGDFNGDGKKDIAVIAQGEKTMYIHYGTGNIYDFTRTPNVTLLLGDACRSISVGDINGDGFDDIVGGYSTVNQAKVFFGGPTLVDYATASFTYQGPSGGSGWKVAAFPNLDGIGTKEIAFGTWTYTNGQTSEGSVTVVYNLAPSITPSVSPSTTPSPSSTASVSPTASVTPSTTPTPSITPSSTPTPSVTTTPSVTPSVTPSASPSASSSITPSVTPTQLPSSSPAVSPSTTPSSSTWPSIPSATPDSGSSSDSPDGPSEGVYILLIVVALLVGIIIGLIIGFLLFTRTRSKKQEFPMSNLNYAYAQLPGYGVTPPGMVPVQAIAMPLYPNLQ